MDSFEHNLENLQLEMNIEPVAVIYKNELEPASFAGALPTLLVLGVILYSIRKSANMMGGKGGKGRGLFGGVMQSTARLINPSEIDVRFK